MLNITSLTCCAPCSPKLLLRFSNSPLPINFEEVSRPKSWASIKIMGGNAKVVKNAVAPASRNGSLLRSNFKEGRKLLRNSFASAYFCAVGIIAIKIVRYFCFRRNRLLKIKQFQICKIELLTHVAFTNKITLFNT